MRWGWGDRSGLIPRSETPDRAMLDPQPFSAYSAALQLIEQIVDRSGRGDCQYRERTSQTARG